VIFRSTLPARQGAAAPDPPKPYTVERTEALASLDRFLSGTGDVELIWLADGVDVGRTGEFIGAWPDLPTSGRSPSSMAACAGPCARRRRQCRRRADGQVLRPSGGGDDVGTVHASTSRAAARGSRLRLQIGRPRTDAAVDLPVEIRNDIARLEIGGEHSAGAVQLLDKRWRRRTVGVVTGSTADTAQPLLASTFYLSRALGPFADIRLAERGSPGEAVSTFIEQRLPMIVLADVGNVAGDARERLTRWVDQGGVLVRFAGPRLAASDDELVPVKLRRGGRILGGSLSWDKPQQLADSRTRVRSTACWCRTTSR